MSSRTKTYLVGRRYLIEKTVQGGDRSKSAKTALLVEETKTSKIIANQLNIGFRTVENAANFTLAVDRIVEVTGIKVNDILNGKITDPMDNTNIPKNTFTKVKSIVIIPSGHFVHLILTISWLCNGFANIGENVNFTVLDCYTRVASYLLPSLDC